jgi:hypothetical protein
MRRKLVAKDIEAAVRGGAVFACGGGGYRVRDIGV